MVEEEYLAHYGILGMKWGQRKAHNSSKGKPKIKSRRKTPNSYDYNRTKDLRKRNYRQLSNTQLQKLNKRLNLEQEYRRLNPKGVEKGIKTTQYVLSLLGAGGIVGGAYRLTKTPYGKAAINVARAGINKARSYV